MAERAWLYWSPMLWIGWKKILARNRNWIRSPSGRLDARREHAVAAEHDQRGQKDLRAEVQQRQEQRRTIRATSTL